MRPWEHGTSIAMVLRLLAFAYTSIFARQSRDDILLFLTTLDTNEDILGFALLCRLPMFDRFCSEHPTRSSLLAGIARIRFSIGWRESVTLAADAYERRVFPPIGTQLFSIPTLRFRVLDFLANCTACM